MTDVGTPAEPVTTKSALPRKRNSTKFDCCDHQLMWRFWVRNDHSAKTTVQCNCRVVIPIDQRIHCVHASLLCSAQKLDLEALPVTVALMPGSYCEQCRVPDLAFGTPCNQRNERVTVPQSERFETIATQRIRKRFTDEFLNVSRPFLTVDGALKASECWFVGWSDRSEF
jgi:hypothetical protein